MRLSNFFFLLSITAGLITAAQAQDYRPPQLPVRELLDAMKAVDQVQDENFPAPSAQIIQNYVLGHPSKGRASGSSDSAAAKQNIYVEWEPGAMPNSFRTWMMIFLNDETWRNLRMNKDQKGQPLL